VLSGERPCARHISIASMHAIAHRPRPSLARCTSDRAASSRRPRASICRGRYKPRRSCGFPRRNRK
jgi:hypothetical protein